MSTFLTLPRELRDEIYSLLLRDKSFTLPTIPQACETNTRRDPEDLSATKIRYSQLPPPKHGILGLSLVNIQIHIEIRDVIVRYIKTGGHVLELDLILEELKFYYTTWISFLPYSLPIQSMRIQIRPFRDVANINPTPNPISSQSSHPFNSTWRLGQLMNRFLRSGPSFGQSEVRPIFITNLVVDILSLPPAQDTSGIIQRQGAKEWSHSAMSANELVDFMVKHFDGFLIVKDNKHYVPWGPMFLTRVSHLTISLDGQAMATFDVEARARVCEAQLARVEMLWNGGKGRIVSEPASRGRWLITERNMIRESDHYPSRERQIDGPHEHRNS